VDVEIQPVLRADEVPRSELGAATRLGWNSWSWRQPMPRDAADAVFHADDRTELDGADL
jgi:predicted component of type VI protein secretion system